jgi:hypothetical protein
MLLEVVSSSAEFETIPIRRHESLLRRIYDRVPVKLDRVNLEVIAWDDRALVTMAAASRAEQCTVCTACMSHGAHRMPCPMSLSGPRVDNWNLTLRRSIGFKQSTATVPGPIPANGWSYNPTTQPASERVNIASLGFMTRNGMCREEAWL